MLSSDVLAAAEALAVRLCYFGRMSSIASLAETGALVGEPARTAMLVALMDGRALTAGELARAAGIMPSTASGHLTRLADGGLLAVATQGRNRYFRLASPEVAGMIESMMSIAGGVAAKRRIRPVRTGPADHAMRRARLCYDHLAGEVAVQLTDFLVTSRYLDWFAEAALVSPAGIAFLRHLGLDLRDEPAQKALQCRPCMDWSERRPHLAGAMGRSLLRLMLDRDWIRRLPASRAVAITSLGGKALGRHFGIQLTPLASTSLRIDAT